MENFNWKKFFDFQPMAFAKIFGLAIKVFIIILLILGVVWIKNLIFPPAPANVNQPEITVSEGGHVEYHVTQGKKERAWWMPSPFCDLYIQKEDSDGYETGIRLGCRWEF